MSGIFGAGQLQFLGGEDAFYGFNITNSLRFNDDDSAFLSRTPSSASNRRTFTFSCWFKYTHGTGQNIWTAGDDVNNRTHIDFNSDGSFQIESKSGGSEQFKLEGTPKYRDPAAWYNLVWAVDTTASSASDRVKAYINGSQVTFSSANYGSQNIDTAINNTVLHVIGKRSYADSNYFNGYIAGDVNFIDGLALTPSSFGETKENIWIPKDTSGLTFGTNGFRLQFKNSSVASASSSTVGADTSGNDHHFSSTNLATTDNMTDSPTDNHCVMSPITVAEGQAQSTLSDGNLKVDLGTPGSSVAHTYGTIAIPASGKYFFEGTFSNVSGGPRIGISVVRTTGNQSRYVYISSGQKIVNTSASSYGASYSASDVVGVAVNVDDNEITFFKNGASQGAFTIDLTASTGGSSSDYFPFITNGSGTSTSVVEFNFGARDFAHTPPVGFVALSTANLPAPAIDPAQGENPTEYFFTLTWTGNTATSRAFTGVGFQPDWLWSKSRSATRSHALFDSVRGVTKYLASDSSAAEISSPSSGFLSSFDADGFTATEGSSNFQNLNNNSETYVGWLWKAGGSAVTNNNGSITSSVSASTEAGFSVASYVGNGSAGATIGHGLSAKPEMFWVKNRDRSAQWSVYHKALGATKFVELSTTAAAASDTPTFNDTEPTATVFSVGTGNGTNASGEDLIAFCFHSVDGFSSIGSYSGNDSSTAGTFVYTGFRPAFVMCKATNASAAWNIFDNKRSGQNPDNDMLQANSSGAENTSNFVDLLSNGFRFYTTSGGLNASASSPYIYMAFAEQPFKFSNAR